MNRYGGAAQSRFKWLFVPVCVPVIVITLTLGCASTSSLKKESRSYDEAVKQDTIEAYEEFIANNPGGVHIADAKKRIVALEWEEAERADTVDAYTSFIQKYADYPSDSDYIGLAQNRLDALKERKESDKGVKKNGKETKPKTVLSKKDKQPKNKEAKAITASAERSFRERLNVRFLTHFRVLNEPEWTSILNRGWRRITALFRNIYSFFFNLREVEIDRGRIVRADQ